MVMEDGIIVDHNAECANADLLSILHVDHYDVIVIEKIASYGMPVGEEIFGTVFWSGRFAEAAKANGSLVFRIPRKDIKVHICNTAKATDANIRFQLVERFGPPGTKKNPGGTYGLKADAWAALAVAVTFFDKYNQKIPMEIVC